MTSRLQFRALCLFSALLSPPLYLKDNNPPFAQGHQGDEKTGGRAPDRCQHSRVFFAFNFRVSCFGWLIFLFLGLKVPFLVCRNTNEAAPNDSVSNTHFAGALGKFKDARLSAAARTTGRSTVPVSGVRVLHRFYFELFTKDGLRFSATRG